MGHIVRHASSGHKVVSRLQFSDSQVLWSTTHLPFLVTTITKKSHHVNVSQKSHRHVSVIVGTRIHLLWESIIKASVSVLWPNQYRSSQAPRHSRARDSNTETMAQLMLLCHILDDKQNCQHGAYQV